MTPKKEEQLGRAGSGHQRGIVHGKLDQFDILIPALQNIWKLRVKHRLEHFIDDSILLLHIHMVVWSMWSAVLNGTKKHPDVVPHS